MNLKKSLFLSVFTFLGIIVTNQSMLGSLDDSQKIVELKQKFNRICSTAINKQDKTYQLKDLFLQTENEIISLEVNYVPRLFLQSAVIVASVPMISIASMNFFKDLSGDSSICLSCSMLPILISLSFYINKKYKLSELNDLKNKIQAELTKAA